MAEEAPLKYQYYVRWASGLMASMVLVYLSALSVQDGYTLEPPVIFGLLALIIILMYGAETLENILRAWRGRNGN